MFFSNFLSKVFKVLCWWGIWGGLFLPVVIWAQVPEDSSDSTEEIVTISVSEINTRSEEVSSHLSKIRLQFSELSILTEIQRDLEELKKQLDPLMADTAAISGKGMGLRELENLRREFFRPKLVLEGWEKQLSYRLELMEREDLGLDSQKVVWQSIYEEAQNEEGREEVAERLKELVEDFTFTDSLLDSWIDTVLTVQVTVSDELLKVNQVLEQIEISFSELRGGLFMRDSPPLWEVDFRQDTLHLGVVLRETLRNDLEAVIDLPKDFPGQLAFQVLLFVLLAVGLYILEKLLDKWSPEIKDKRTRAAEHLLSYPLSGALLVVLLLTPVLYPTARMGVIEFAQLLLLIPLISLLSGFLPRGILPALYGLSALYLLDEIGDNFIIYSLLGRFWSLLLAIIGMLGLFWIRRWNKVEHKIRDNLWWSASMALTPLGILLLAGSALANLFGNMSLAQLLLTGMLRSTYLAVVFYAGALLLISMVVLAVRSKTAKASYIISKYPRETERYLVLFIEIGLVIFWLILTLMNFDLYTPLVDWFTGLLYKEWGVSSMKVTLGSLLAFLFTLWLSWTLARFLKFLLDEEILVRTGLQHGTSGTISMMTRYIVVAFGFFLAVAAAGIDLKSFTLIAGALGVGIGFGLQNIVNNLLSGIILAFERPIKIGDYVQMGTLMGKVLEIGFRSSRVRTLDGSEVIVPNGDLVSNQVVNWTLSDRNRRAHLQIGIGYGNDPEHIIQLLTKTVSNQPEVMAYPQPFVVFKGFGENALEFDIYFWSGSFEEFLEIKSKVAIAISRALKEEGIKIPFPQRDLHIRTMGTALEKSEEKEEGDKEGGEPAQTTE